MIKAMPWIPEHFSRFPLLQDTQVHTAVFIIVEKITIVFSYS